MSEMLLCNHIRKRFIYEYRKIIDSDIDQKKFLITMPIYTVDTHRQT